MLQRHPIFQIRGFEGVMRKDLSLISADCQIYHDFNLGCNKQTRGNTGHGQPSRHLNRSNYLIYWASRALEALAPGALRLLHNLKK